MRSLVVLLALALLAPAGWASSSSANKSTKFSSRCFPSYLKQPVPDISQDTGTTYLINLIDYFGNPDPNATADPACGNVANTYSVTLGPSGLAVNATNPKLPTYGGTITGGAASGTATYHADNSIGVEVTDTAAWTVTAVGGSGTPIPLDGHNFFVKATGNDALDGKSPANAWRTLSKVTNSTFAVGDNVWLEGGSVWNQQTLTINLPGGSSTTARTIIGAYTVSGGIPIQLVPSNDSNSQRYRNYTYAVAPPKILGTYNTACRNSIIWWGNVVHPDPQKCAWGGANGFNNLPANQGTPVPSGQNFALVSMNSTSASPKHFITIQDIQLGDSAGQGFSLTSSQGRCTPTNTICNVDWILQRVKVDGTAGTPIATNSIAQVVIRKFETRLNDLSQVDAQYHTQTDIRGGVAVAVSNCDPCQALIEQGDIHDGWGEAMGFYGVSGVLVRGMESSGHVRSGIDGGAASHLIFEQNIAASGGPVNDARAIALAASQGVTLYTGGQGRGTFDYENAGTNGNPVGPSLPSNDRNGYLTVRRNNFVITLDDSCFGEYSQSGAPSWLRIGNWDVGNSCWVTTGRGWALENALSSHVDAAFKVNVLDNLFVHANAAANTQPCYVQAFDAARFNFNNNFWDNGLTPVSNCRGPNDILGGADGLGVFDFTTTNWATAWPTVAQMTPAQASSAAADLAQSLTANVIPQNYVDINGVTQMTNMWTWMLARRQWLPTCNSTTTQISETNWIKGLWGDFCSNARSATPDPGAIEYN